MEISKCKNKNEEYRVGRDWKLGMGITFLNEVIFLKRLERNERISLTDFSGRVPQAEGSISAKS